MGLRREFERMGMQAPYSCTGFDTPAHHDLLYKVAEVGEALALFGTQDFGERSNSSRAITAKVCAAAINPELPSELIHVGCRLGLCQHLSACTVLAGVRVFVDDGCRNCFHSQHDVPRFLVLFTH